MDGSNCCGFGPGAVDEGFASTGGGMFNSDGISYAVWMAVRPVVSLQSGVTVEDLSVSSSGSEEPWTTSLPEIYDREKLEYGQITE